MRVQHHAQHVRLGNCSALEIKKRNRRQGVLIRLIMFERAARRGFAKNIIQSYQTTVLIESFSSEV